jgi:radical SAM-linked protein
VAVIVTDVPYQPAQQPPPAQRLRVRYAKRGRQRFTSHRDFSRALERAVQRAAIPVAYTSGFSPHPRIAYANAAPTGSASEAEYLELALREECRPGDVRSALDEALPAGLDVLDVVVAAPGALADRLEGSRWRIELPGVPHAEAAEAVAAFLDAERVEVQRMTKSGLRTFDCRRAVLTLDVYRATRAEGPALGDDSDTQREYAILEVVVRHETPAVRPDDILTGLRELAGLTPPVPPMQTRLAQGPVDPETGDVGDPLAPDRDASATRGDR